MTFDEAFIILQGLAGIVCGAALVYAILNQ